MFCKLRYVGLGTSTITMNNSGSLSLASMAMPTTVLTAAEGQLSGAGSTLRLSAVTMPEHPEVGELTGTTMVEVDDSKTSAMIQSVFWTGPLSSPPPPGRAPSPTAATVSAGPGATGGARTARSPSLAAVGRGSRGLRRVRHGGSRRPHHPAGRLDAWRLLLSGWRGPATCTGRQRRLNLGRRRPRQRRPRKPRRR